MSNAGNASDNRPTNGRSALPRLAQRLFRIPYVEFAIGGLIIVSIALTLLEVSLPTNSDLLPALEAINLGVTWVFVVELTLRFIATTPKRRFFRQYWIDIIAVLPILRAFRVFRALRLLRLLRMLRLIGLFTRYAHYLPYVLRRGALEYIIVGGLILLTLVFGTAAILAFEKDTNPELATFGDTFWFSIYALFAGEPPDEPHSFGGHVVAIFVMFMGLSVFAMFTGTVSALLVERLRKEGSVVEWEDFENHIIICGWNRRAEIIVREYQAAHRMEEAPPIVVVAELDKDPDFLDPQLRHLVRFLKDDFTKISVLEKAGVHRAATCIILADTSHGRSEQDADARTILAALTIEKINHRIYTCAELHNREYGSHLDMGKVNDYVVSGEHSGFLLAHAALNQGLMEVFTELLTYERGNQFYRIPVRPEWVGMSFLELFVHLKRQHRAILVAVQTEDGQCIVNPDDHTFRGGESVILIADGKDVGRNAKQL